MKAQYGPGLRLRDEDGGPELIFTLTNRGEPYREGVNILMQGRDYQHITSAFLEEREARELKDWLQQLYP